MPEEFILNDEVIEFGLDWTDRLPYPEGEDITNRIDDLKEGLEGSD